MYKPTTTTSDSPFESSPESLTQIKDVLEKLFPPPALPEKKRWVESFCGLGGTMEYAAEDLADKINRYIIANEFTCLPVSISSFISSSDRNYDRVSALVIFEADLNYDSKI